jgi:prepilin-type N-terminal cleavage/methylation domain-containing protein
MVQVHDHACGRGERHRSGGFTMIEVLVVATMLAVAILGMSQISQVSAALRVAGREKAAAIRTLDREVASIQATNFASIPTRWDNTGFEVTLEDKGRAILHPLPGDVDGMPGNVAISAPNGDPAQLLEIRVRIDWNGTHGPQHVQRTVRLSALGAGS